MAHWGLWAIPVPCGDTKLSLCPAAARSHLCAEGTDLHPAGTDPCAGGGTEVSPCPMVARSCAQRGRCAVLMPSGDTDLCPAGTLSSSHAWPKCWGRTHSLAGTSMQRASPWGTSHPHGAHHNPTGHTTTPRGTPQPHGAQPQLAQALAAEHSGAAPCWPPNHSPPQSCLVEQRGPAGLQEGAPRSGQQRRPLLTHMCTHVYTNTRSSGGCVVVGSCARWHTRSALHVPVCGRLTLRDRG